MSARPDCPALAKGTRVVRQTEGGKVRYVVRAGGTGKYLRVGEPEQILLNLMDGSRTMAEIRVSFVARAKETLALEDVIDFVGRMRRARVVEETAERKNLVLVEKARQQRKERLFGGSAGSVLFMRFKLLDPDRFLTHVEPWFRWVYTRGFVVFAACLVAAAAGVLFARREEVLSRLKDFMLITAGAHVNLLALWATAICVVAIHETAHGITCKHYGGEVHEMGFLLLFFQPCFYCNVNDAWTFESRTARLLTTGAGGLVELVMGSASVLVWAATEDGATIHGIAYLVFMISLSSSILANLNPLIKLDGYYLFADFVRVENLRDRSFAQVSWLVRSKLLGLPAARVATDRRDAWILSLYGVASMLYQALILVALTVILFGVAFGGGANPGAGTVIVLGWVCWIMLQRPLRAAGGIVTETIRTLKARWGPRGFWGRVGGAAGAVVLVALVLPWTRTSGARCTAGPCREVEVHAPVDGVVAEVLVAEGARVREGDPLLRISAPEEEARARIERQKAETLRREAMRHRAAGDASGASTMEKEAEAAAIEAADLERRLARCTVPSPLTGVVLTRRLEESRGMHVAQGAGLLRVGDCSRIHFRALMDARAVGPVKVGMEARVHLRSFPGRTLEGKVFSVSRQPVHEEDTRLKEVTGAHWEVVVEVDPGEAPVLPGMTGEVAILVARSTLAAAFVRGVRDTVRSDLLR